MSDFRYQQLLQSLEPLYEDDGPFGKHLASIEREILNPECSWDDVVRLRGEYRGAKGVLDRLRGLAADESVADRDQRDRNEELRRATELRKHGLSPFRR